MTRSVRITSSSFNTDSRDTDLTNVFGDDNGIEWAVPDGGSLYISKLRYEDKMRAGFDSGNVPTNPFAPTVFVDIDDIGTMEVSVRDFGAVGNGTTDDTYAIQSALDFVEQNGGGVVLIPVGTFFVTRLTVGNGVVLRGVSSVSSCIFGDWTSDDSPIVVNGSVAGIERMRVAML